MQAGADFSIDRGASLAMWNEYFTHPEARLGCVDDKRKHLRNVPRDPRWKSFQGDQSDRSFMESVGTALGPLDVVIETALPPCPPVASRRLV